MPQVDSIDKIVEGYFSVITDEEFTYKGKLYSPKGLVITPNIFRGFTCPSHCGACCSNFSLDYLPDEEIPYDIDGRYVKFNGKLVLIYTDWQKDNKEHYCINLNMKNGRCMIHGTHPFSCDFELIRTIKFASVDRANRMTTKLYGRGWAMKRIDGDRGAQCSMLPITQETVSNTIRRLERLHDWAGHFGLKHRVGKIIEWADSPSKRQSNLVFL